MRKIIHCDCDCFYASVEMRDNKALCSLPIAVGGSKNGRGVLTTCNYIARSFGVRSAMPTRTALQLCPRLVILPVDMQKYRDASNQIKAIFSEFTERVEPVSLDEAYLDVSHNREFSGSASLLANHIREKIHSEVGVTASAGIAPNKFLAKIASDINKPNGQFVITPNDVDAFMPGLNIRKIPGVGTISEKKLNKLGIYTCSDIQSSSPDALIKAMGSFGEVLLKRSFGIDDREVQHKHVRKSISIERTFPEDLKDFEACLKEAPYLLENFQNRFSRLSDKYHVKTCFVKIKFNDFSQTTLEKNSVKTFTVENLESLVYEAWARKSRPVRLIGLGARISLNEKDKAKRQLELLP